MNYIVQKLTVVTLFAFFIVMLGCSPAHYKKSADKEVYGIVKKKSENIGGMPSKFIVEQEKNNRLTADNMTTKTLTLNEAIEVGLNNSRDYQTQKEALYLQGLTLTSVRHQYAPIFSGSYLKEIDKTDAAKSVSDTLNFGVDKMLATGGDLSINIASSLVKVISGGDSKTAVSAASASLVQPLLKGAGKKVAYEKLTQAERDTTYSIREFVRFRKTFSVDIAKKYYDVLKLRQEVENFKENYKNFSSDRKRLEVVTESGRIPAFSLYGVQQDVLDAYNDLIKAQQEYETGLDEFKLMLGIPTNYPIDLDPSELKKVAKKGVIPIPTTLDNAMQYALENRLDLKNYKGRYEDAKRRIYVAKNGLLPEVDLILNYNAASDANKQLFNFNKDKELYSAGLNFIFPFDKKEDRNIYRKALIDYDAADRKVDEITDTVKFDVRDSYRNIIKASESYEAKRVNVDIGSKRIDSALLLQQAGRATVDDVKDARKQMIKVQNEANEALVDYYNAQLDLYLAMESLKIDDNGVWQEDEQNVTGK